MNFKSNLKRNLFSKIIFANLILATTVFAGIAFAQQPPPYDPNRPIQPPSKPLPPLPQMQREESRFMPMGSMMINGQNSITDITAYVRSANDLRVTSSIALLARTAAGRGRINLIVNGRPMNEIAIQTPSRKTFIQFDVNLESWNISRVEIQTSGQFEISGLNVNSSENFIGDSVKGVACETVSHLPPPSPQPIPAPPTPAPYPTNPGFPVPYGPFTCDAQNNKLLDGNFQMVYDFSNINDCQAAIRQIELRQPFCDSNDNTLRMPLGSLIYDFGSIENCKLGIRKVTEGKPFCDYNDNTLRQVDGKLIYDFSSEAECTAAMNRY